MKEKLYVYRIQTTKVEIEKIFAFLAEESNQDLPLLFESMKGNLYLVMHGTKEGYLSTIENYFTIEVLHDCYRYFVFAKGQKRLNLICSHPLCIPSLQDASGIETGAAFRVMHTVQDLKCRAVRSEDCGYFEIACEEKINRKHNTVKDDIKYCQKIPADQFEAQTDQTSKVIIL